MSASLLRWIAGNDTGISSRAIWSHMMTGSVAEPGHPHDPSDFGRCYRLLALMPSWESRLGEMGRYSHEWRALAPRWTELKPMYERWWNAPERSDEKTAAWHAMYAVMRQIIEGARVCVDCGRTGMNAWTTYDARTIRCYQCADAFDKKRRPNGARSTVEIGSASVEVRS